MDRLERLEPTRRQWRRWALSEPALAGTTFAALRGELLDPAVDHGRKDDVLAALVRLARSDPDAAAAVTVCLLPGLRRQVRRFAPSLDQDEAWAELLASLQEQILRYPLDRRPRRIAANLIWDATGRLRRAVHIHLTQTRHTCPWSTRAGFVAEPHLSASAVLGMALHAGVLTPSEISLVAATRLGGLRLDEVASLLGVGYEAAKKRRQRAEAAWASWWAPERFRRGSARPCWRRPERAVGRAPLARRRSVPGTTDDGERRCTPCSG